MDYRKTASEILTGIGGKENLISAAHCATRLRLVIADNGKCDKDTVENIDGVKGVFFASGQMQIILGTGTVNKVYDEFIELSGASAATKEEVKQAAAAKQNVLKRAIKTLGDVFVPIIPAIVASGLLMGLLEGLCNVWPQMAQSGSYTIIHLFSNAAFVFLPILIAVSAAKVFGGNQFLGAVIGMIMIHTDLINAWSVAGMNAADIPTASAWFGLYDVKLVGYQGHVIPVVIAVWVMSKLEKKLHKIVPEIIDLFVTPLVTVLVTGYLTLTVIGPVFSTLENWVLTGARTLIMLPFGIGGFLVGGLYAPTVVAGVHHMYNAIEAGLLSANGLNTWMPIATAANVGQGAACLAIALKSKNAKTKSIALPASLSAYLGITEPAIFGVNLRYMKPLIAGCIGGAAGGLVAGIFKIGATAYGITGIFGFLITTNYIWQYALVIIVSTVVAFVASWLMYKEEPVAEKAGTSESHSDKVTALDEQKDTDAQKNEEAVCKEKDIEDTEASATKIVYSPMNGEAIPLSEVKDETFASAALGQGMAVIPSEGAVYAPFDGEVTMLFDTHHAIGLMSDGGVELLIHIGINTVELNGKFFHPCIEDGTKITKGMKLMEMDLDEIKNAGYDITTPVICTNSDDFKNVICLTTGEIESGAPVLSVND